MGLHRTYLQNMAFCVGSLNVLNFGQHGSSFFPSGGTYFLAIHSLPVGVVLLGEESFNLRNNVVPSNPCRVSLHLLKCMQFNLTHVRTIRLNSLNATR